MKVHDTKQQLQGFPIFRRGAKWSQRGLYTNQIPAGWNTYRPPDQFVAPQHKMTTQMYIPKSGVANWLKQVGSLNRHPTHHRNVHRRWSKGKVEGRSTICKLEAKRQRTNEFPGPTCEQLCTNTNHVHSSASVASTYIC